MLSISKTDNAVKFPPSELLSDEPPLESDRHLNQIILLLLSLEWWWQERPDAPENRRNNFFADLSGVPDYILAKRSPLGPIVFDRPYFLVVEAKQDKFEEDGGSVWQNWWPCRKSMTNPSRPSSASSLMASFGNLAT